MVIEPRQRLFTVEEYHRMGEAGILGPDDRVELIDGVIVEMSPIGSPHSGCVNRLTELLIERLRRRAMVRVQDPVVLNERSEPQPDLSVARRRDDSFATAHPRPEDLHLLIEVADTTYAQDVAKVRRYARAGVPETWIIDVRQRRIEVHREPTETGYADVRAVEAASPLAFPDITITAQELFAGM